MSTYEVHEIGKICSSEAGVFIELKPQYIPGLLALDGFSHINIIWWFSSCDTRELRSVLDADDNTPVLDIKPYTPSLDRVESPGVPEWCRHWPKSIEESGDFPWEGEFNF